MNIKLKEKDDICEKREAKIISLRKELEQVKRSWQSSLALDNILNTQKPNITSLELVSKENHQVQRIMTEVMLMYSLAI